jgi:hypothetical protein
MQTKTANFLYKKLMPVDDLPCCRSAQPVRGYIMAIIFDRNERDNDIEIHLIRDRKSCTVLSSECFY